MFVLPLVFAAAAASSTLTDAFLQRLANAGVGPAKTVTVGALPPGWKSPAPLPNAQPLLGSVLAPNNQADIYYQPLDAAAALQAYTAQLRAAGFLPHMGVAGHAGFVSGQFLPHLTVMCRGNEGVSILSPGKDDLRVSFAASPALGPCAAQPPRFSSPVPDLIAPRGVTVVALGGGGMTWGQFTSSSTYSSATFHTSLSAKQLLSLFAAQLERAQWKPQRAFTAPQGAAQSFRYDRGDQHWHATLLFFSGDAAHTYEARMDASGTPDVSVPALPAVRPAPVLRKSQEAASLQLVQRVAQSAVYVRGLPPSFNTAIPTPEGALLGSTAANSGQTLYYDVTAAQYDAYRAKLLAAGWTALRDTRPHAGGFAQVEYPVATTYCKPELPTLSVAVRPNTNELTIAIANERAPHSCTAAEASPFAQPFQAAPVPELRAPAGMSMRPGSAGIMNGQSGATITSTQPASRVLAGFAAQLTAAGWAAGAPLANEAIGSQSFAYTDRDGSKWQAVVTIYRSQQDPKTYYAFIDATKL